MELVPREDKSPSSSGTSYSGGSSGAPDGRVGESVDEYVHAGWRVGSRNSCGSSISSVRGIELDAFLECSVPVLRLVPGRPFLFGLMLLAFLRLEVHHSSLSSATDVTEVFELLELLIEGAAEGLDRSFAILSLRCPTFSVSGSVQDKSAANMVDTDEGKLARWRTHGYTKVQKRK